MTVFLYWALSKPSTPLHPSLEITYR